jgi:hypothetical protein
MRVTVLASLGLLWLSTVALVLALSMAETSNARGADRIDARSAPMAAVEPAASRVARRVPPDSTGPEF